MNKIAIISFFILGFFFTSHSQQQNIGVGTTNPLQKLHIGGAASTLRIDGIATGGNFLTASSSNTDRLLYANSNGDIISIPAGSIGSVLMLNNSGYLTWAALNASAITGGQALTKTDDANVTLTLGGTPSTSLLSATSLTLGWTGQLSTSRGGTGLGSIGSANQLLGVNNAGTGLEYKTVSTSTTAVSNDVGVTVSNANSIAINLPSASSTVRGVLSSADWASFNNRWSLTGNGSTLPASNFIGTTDAVNLVFRVNSANANGGWSGFIDQTANGLTFFGYLAGKTTIANNNTNNSTDNTAMGANALTANTYAGQNTSLGSGALQTQSFGSSAWLADNTALGYKALFANQPTSTGSGYQNTAVGSQALYANTTGSWNTATGYFALKVNTTGAQSTALGAYALQSSINGDNNTAVGYSALFNSTGSYNTAIGSWALNGINPPFGGTYNVAVGEEALRRTSQGAFNVALGSSAMYYNQGGSNATAIGYQALFYANPTTAAFTNADVAVGYQALMGSTTAANNIGNFNTALGYQSLFGNSFGANNVSVGYQSLNANTAAGNNTAVGYQALLTQSYANGNVAWASENTAIGYKALSLNQPTSSSGFSGSYNTAVGSQALLKNTSGYWNTAVGALCLTNVSTGNTNTAIGYQCAYNTSTGSNNIAVGYSALNGNIGGNNNIAVGSGGVLQSNINGGDNTVIGNAAMNAQNTSVNQNTVVGSAALQQGKTGSNNVAIGYQALFWTNAGNNTAIGNQAGFPGAVQANATTIGTNNTLVGSGSGQGTSIPVSNATAIGANATVSQSNSLILGAITGVNGGTSVNVGIGTNAPANLLQVGGSAISSVQFYNTGQASQSGFTVSPVSGAVFSATMIGKKIVFANGTVSNITGFSSPNLTVDVSATVSTSNYTISTVTTTAGNAGFNVTSSGTVGVGTTAPNSSLQVSGSIATALIVQTGNYGLLATDAIVEANSASGITLTLPTAVGITGRQYTLKNINTGVVSVATTSAQTIDGGASYSLSAQWKYVSVVSDGANWIVVANN